MKPILPFIYVAIAFTAAAAQEDSDQDDFPYSKKEIHLLLREASKKVERKFQITREEAKGLTQAIDKALTAAPPSPAAVDQDDPRRSLTKEMGLIYSEHNIGLKFFGIRGFINTAPGSLHQRMDDLEQMSASGGGEVRRWLERSDLAEYLEWTEKEQEYQQTAEKHARALVSREPQNPEAHALLAAALDWSREKKQALETALKLDPGQPLALRMLLSRRIETTLESAALRKEVPLEGEDEMQMLKVFFERPPSETERQALEERAAELALEAEQVLEAAYERKDLPAYLNTLSDMNELTANLSLIDATAQRDSDQSFDAFFHEQFNLHLMSYLQQFKDQTHLSKALELARHDPEALGAVMLQAVFGESFQSSGALPEFLVEQLKPPLDHLVAMAGADESLKAARAAEAVVKVEFALAALAENEPPHADLLLRAIRLDPYRYQTLDILMGICGTYGDMPVSMAIAQLQAALVPMMENRRLVAAIASKTGDWQTAHRYLDICLQEQPDHVMTLNQKAATWLKENPSDEMIQQASSIFDPILAKIETCLDDLSEQNDREILIRNCALFLVLRGEKEKAEDILTTTLDEEWLSEDEVEAIKTMLKPSE